MVQTSWPRHHDTDHRMIVGLLKGGSRSRLKRYRRRRARLPLSITGPQTRTEAWFEELKATVKKPDVRTLPRNSWISEATWDIVDRRAWLRKTGRLSQVRERNLTRRIYVSLTNDRRQRAEKAGTEIQSHLAAGELKEAWGTAKRWYRQATDTPPKPCFASLEKQTTEREELYAKRVVPDDPIPIVAEPFDLEDGVPDEAEIRSGHYYRQR